MWGYRTPRYARLGFFAARADDALAWLPARLTVAAMWCAAWFLGLAGGVRLGDVRRDAKRSASPNAGWPMAAAAWLCGGTMGGAAMYFGVPVAKPAMGPPGVPWNAQRYAKLERLVMASGLLVAIVIICLSAIY